jgi:hypothetical protein
MILIYNPSGCFCLLGGGLLGFGISYLVGLFASEAIANRVGAAVIGGVFLLSDLTFRLSCLKEQGWRSIIVPQRGGHLYFIPCWLIGLVIYWFLIREWL